MISSKISLHNSLLHALHQPIVLSSVEKKAIQSNRLFLESKLAIHTPIYGITTGFGPLVHQTVSKENQIDLQYNLLQQLSGNVGPELDYSTSRLIFFIRIHALSQARSGVSVEFIEHLIHLFNNGLAPVFRQFGSVGASGDLVPLASLGRFVIGKDACWFSESEQISTTEAFERHQIETYVLKEKEGLALVNGTSYSCGIAIQNLLRFETLLEKEIIPAISVQLISMGDSLQHLSKHIYEFKTHESAKYIAAIFRDWLHPLIPELSHGIPQAPYSSRSIVLWIGTVYQRLMDAKTALENELNAVDDNPLFFHEEELILHAANFQGTFTAYAADSLTASIAQLSLLLERIVNRLTHDKLNGDLPAFLADEPLGLHSGLQGLQLMMSSLSADIKTRTQYHSLSTIATNADNQDVVSMSANAAHAGTDCLERFEIQTQIFKLMVLRTAQLKNPEIASPLLLNWYKTASKKIEGIVFSDSDLDYKKLLSSMVL